MKKGFLDGYDTYDNSKGQGNAKAWRSAFRDRISKEQAEEILQQQPNTPHAILCVSVNASQAEIKKAFRQLINEWHPDKNPHPLAEAEEKSKQIIAAYSVLIH